MARKNESKESNGHGKDHTSRRGNRRANTRCCSSVLRGGCERTNGGGSEEGMEGDEADGEQERGTYDFAELGDRGNVGNHGSSGGAGSDVRVVSGLR